MFTFEIEAHQFRSSSQLFVVKKLSGDWPPDEDLITICDNRDSTDMTVCHFGGSVRKVSDDERWVTVYID